MKNEEREVDVKSRTFVRHAASSEPYARCYQ